MTCFMIQCLTGMLPKTVDSNTLFVVVYHVTIVAIGHGLLNNCWPMVIGVLRPEESSII